jgi:predicted nuclease of restriction endonuclease-like RecB superfamily
LLPDDLLSCSIAGALVVPHFLGEHDHPWLRALLEEYERFIGRPQRELDARLREPLPCESPPTKLRLAVRVLGRLRLRPSHRKTMVSPPRARALVFEEAGRTLAPPQTILSAVAASLEVTPEDLRDSLFGDLPGERLVGAWAQPLSAGELALRCNLALVQALLFRATIVRIEVEGNTRTLVRQAKWRGLICTGIVRSDTADATLEVSGPFALFRNTRLYGRALGELVPLLAWCLRFRLRAECVLRGRHLTLQLGTGDPIFPASAPCRYDSHLEERFAREFRRLAPAWDVIREPEPITAAGTLIFPDFALQHRSNPARRWLLEIVGFWTPDYVTRKLALYRSARLSNLILCIDEDRNCAGADPPSEALVVSFRRWVDAAAVLRVTETTTRPAAGHCRSLADGQGAAADTRTVDDDD